MSRLNLYVCIVAKNLKKCKGFDIIGVANNTCNKKENYEHKRRRAPCTAIKI